MPAHLFRRIASTAPSTPLTLVEWERHVLNQIALGVPLERALETLLRAVEGQSDTGMRTSVLLLSEDAAHLRHGAGPSLPAAYNAAIDGIPVGEGIGSCGTAAHWGRPVYAGDIATDPFWTAFRDLALSHGLRACWSTPIQGIDGAILGTFAIYYDAPRSPTEADIEAIAFITQTTALAIERHRTDLQLRRGRDALQALDAHRTRAEAALRESEARLRTSETYWRGLFERLNEGFMVVDVVRDAAGIARTWRFAEINAAWERISGLSQAAAIGRNVEEVIPGIERDWIDLYIRVAETGEPAALRMPLRVLGQVYDIRASRIGPDRVAVLFQEISAQQREEVRRTALLALHDRFRDLDDIAELAFTAAAVTGRALELDRAGYVTVTVAGDGEDLVTTRDWTSPDRSGAADPCPPASGSVLLAGLRQGRTLVDGHATPDAHVDAGCPGAGTVATGTAIHLPLLEGGRLVAFFVAQARHPRAWIPEEIAFIRNVAEHTRSTIERRRAEGELRALALSLEQQVEERSRELAETQEALSQSQKMEAVGQLTGGVAHDFNNLLTIIRSSVDFLRRPELPDARKQRYLDAVSDTVDRAAKLTGQLLAFARRQALKPEVFDAGDKLRGVAEMLDTVTGTRIRVALKLPDRPCFVRADVSQFETAVINMAVNARDAMDGEGRLVLRLEGGVPMPQIRGHAGSRGPFAAVSVSDTGSGIPPEQLGRIFEPFFTTKEVGKGTGLGLSQVFGFAKQSGGDVAVHSVVGAGTTFTLYLPEGQGRVAPAVSAGPDPSLAPIGAGQRVLVVEDNIEVGRFCKQILDDLAYATVWVTNAEAALDLLDADGAGFAAVFSDVVMPGMGGVALAEILRERLPALPVVLASGYSHVLAREADHGFELLHKPYSAEQLVRVLQRVTARSGA